MRMCCGCRTKRPITHLIRLQICKQTHQLIPCEQKQSGRSGWVCFDIQCVQSILKHPKKLHRSLNSTPQMTDFRDSLIQWIEFRCKVILSRLYTDGVLRLKETNPSYDTLYIWSEIEMESPFMLFQDSQQWSRHTTTTRKQPKNISTSSMSNLAFTLKLPKQHKSIPQLYINLGLLEALKTQ